MKRFDSFAHHRVKHFLFRKINSERYIYLKLFPIKFMKCNNILTKVLNKSVLLLSNLINWLNVSQNYNPVQSDIFMICF